MLRVQNILLVVVGLNLIAKVVKHTERYHIVFENKLSITPTDQRKSAGAIDVDGYLNGG